MVDIHYGPMGYWNSIATPGNILYMHPANERRRYIVASSLIAWARSQIDPWHPECLISNIGYSPIDHVDGVKSFRYQIYPQAE